MIRSEIPISEKRTMYAPHRPGSIIDDLSRQPKCSSCATLVASEGQVAAGSGDAVGEGVATVLGAADMAGAPVSDSTPPRSRGHIPMTIPTTTTRPSPAASNSTDSVDRAGIPPGAACPADPATSRCAFSQPGRI